MSLNDARVFGIAEKARNAPRPERQKGGQGEIAALEVRHQGNTLRLAHQLEELTHLESRVTILGYVQRGGTPSRPTESWPRGWAARAPI